MIFIVVKIIISENQFDNILKRYEQILSNLNFKGIKRITLDYDESIDSIKLNIFYDMHLAIDLGMEFSPFQYRMNRKIFNAVEKIKLGPKYLYYLHYE